MVTARVRKLGWCNEYVKGRCSLDTLLLKVPDLKEHTDFIEQLTAKRDMYLYSHH